MHRLCSDRIWGDHEDVAVRVGQEREVYNTSMTIATYVLRERCMGIRWLLVRLLAIVLSLSVCWRLGIRRNVHCAGEMYWRRRYCQYGLDADYLMAIELDSSADDISFFEH
jgi:hypothetical protein